MWFKYGLLRRYKQLKKNDKKIKLIVLKSPKNKKFIRYKRKNSPLLKHRDSEIDTGKLDKKAMIAKMSRYVEKVKKKNMATEYELKESNPLRKEFQNLLDKDFANRKLKENEIIKATVTEITDKFIVVDCKAKMEGLIPIEEFKNDDELSN